MRTLLLLLLATLITGCKILRPENLQANLPVYRVSLFVAPTDPGIAEALGRLQGVHDTGGLIAMSPVSLKEFPHARRLELIVHGEAALAELKDELQCTALPLQLLSIERISP